MAKHELNHVQSATRGTNAYGNPVPVPSNKESIASPGKDNRDAGSNSADSVQKESASNAEVNSVGEEEGGNHQGPHKKNSHSAHRGV